jgi:4'-phosphopantetheinyl transferase
MSADNARLGHAMDACLDHTQLHLWLVFPERIRDEAPLQRYREVLSAAERARIGRFHFPQDRHSYLLTRAASRMVLYKYAPVAPEDWQFSVSSHGRPQIINAHPDAASLSFNISHTAGLIAIGVTRHNAIGIDVENMQRRPAPLDIARSCFAPDECAALQAQPRSAEASGSIAPGPSRSPM